MGAKPDFGGYATKAGLKCSDGRTIMPDAFKEQDGITVPLVWQHGHTAPENVLGHAILEHRADGVYCYGFFNETTSGQSAKQLVEHKDITMLSIYANRLVEKSKQVFHGAIREVSLVLSGANPGALIDHVSVQHADGDITELDDEAIIYTGLTLEHSDDSQDDDEDLEHADGPTVQDVYDSMTEEQKTVVHFMIGAALEDSAAQHSDDDQQDNDTDSDEDNLEHKEGNNDMGVKRNVFENGAAGSDTAEDRVVLSHSDIEGIVSDAKRLGSLKAAVEDYAVKHGIDDIDMLFPDPKNLTNTPDWTKRRTEWVSSVLGGVNHTPFSRIKTMTADITHDEARAKGYIKGTLKKEEFFGLMKRVTTPCTIYKKQKLDRDDIIDITDFDVVAWLKGEMRMMLEEEVAGAILVGDGRDSGDEDKIQDGSVSGVGIRPIALEDELYAPSIYVQSDATANEIVDVVISTRTLYKGSGNPTFYTSEAIVAKFLTARDTLGRRIYRTLDEVASDLRVNAVIPVEVMDRAPGVLGIFVNLSDYNVGTDRGGEVNMFDDFDIDYNQYKYLIETRFSGALTKLRSAVILKSVGASSVLTVPTEPTFNATTGVITIPTQTGVVYKNDTTNATLTAGAQSALAVGESLTVRAEPASGAYYFVDNINEEWTYTREA